MCLQFRRKLLCVMSVNFFNADSKPIADNITKKSLEKNKSRRKNDILFFREIDEESYPIEYIAYFIKQNFPLFLLASSRTLIVSFLGGFIDPLFNIGKEISAGSIAMQRAGFFTTVCIPMLFAEPDNYGEMMNSIGLNPNTKPIRFSGRLDIAEGLDKFSAFSDLICTYYTSEPKDKKLKLFNKGITDKKSPFQNWEYFASGEWILLLTLSLQQLIVKIILDSTNQTNLNLRSAFINLLSSVIADFITSWVTTKITLGLQYLIGVQLKQIANKSLQHLDKQFAYRINTSVRAHGFAPCLKKTNAFYQKVAPSELASMFYDLGNDTVEAYEEGFLPLFENCWSMIFALLAETVTRNPFIFASTGITLYQMFKSKQNQIRTLTQKQSEVIEWERNAREFPGDLLRNIMQIKSADKKDHECEEYYKLYAGLAKAKKSAKKQIGLITKKTNLNQMWLVLGFLLGAYWKDANFRRAINNAVRFVKWGAYQTRSVSRTIIGGDLIPMNQTETLPDNYITLASSLQSAATIFIMLKQMKLSNAIVETKIEPILESLGRLLAFNTLIQPKLKSIYSDSEERDNKNKRIKGKNGELVIDIAHGGFQYPAL